MHVLSFKNKLALLFGAAVSLAAFLILTQLTLNTVDRIIIHGKFKSDLQLKTTLVSPIGSTRVSITNIAASKGNETIRFSSGKHNFSTQDIVLEFSKIDNISESGALKSLYLNIYSIEILLPYATKIQISQKHLRKYFSSNEFVNNTSILVINGSSRKATLNLIQPLSETPSLEQEYYFIGLLSIFIGLSIFLLVKYTSWRNIPAFSDMSLGRHISSAAEFNLINGIRGLAAILVVLSHTAPGFIGVNVGIALLFILSGFLLSKPFILNPTKIFKLENIEKYLVKRLRRILPMYYLFIFVTYVVAMDLETAVRHFLFIEAGNHLWPMTQIFTFYMLLPLVLLITCLLHRAHVILPIVVLFISIILYIDIAQDWKPYYNGRYHKQFYLYAFLMGVLGSYIQYGFIKNSERLRVLTIKFKNSFGLLAAGITITTIVWSAPITPPDFLGWYFGHFQFKCILSILIILIVLNSERSWFSPIIGNWIFRSIGVVGFSFYLLHSLGMQIVLEFQREILGIIEPLERSWVFALSTLIVTYLMALISYSYVERPFFGYRKQK